MEKQGHSKDAVEELATAYLEKLTVRRYSPRSVETYGRVIRDFAVFVAGRSRQTVRDITADDLVQYRLSVKDRGFKDASIQVYMRAVKQFFGFLEENQHVFVNPTAGQAIFRMPRLLMPVPTEEEMLILLRQPDVTTNLGVRNRTILEVAYSTALRRQELTDLEIRSLSIVEGTARVMGKGNRERVVPLGGDAIRWVQRYLEVVRPVLLKGNADGALWINQRGHKMTSHAIQAMLVKHCRAEGITTRITLHSIRRACASGRRGQALNSE